MRAIIVEEFGPIASHKVGEAADPAVGENDVLIENHAVGLNFPDALMLQGKYQKQPERPFVPGRDCAGIVKSVGKNVSRCKPGDRVVAQVFTGAFGEMVAAPEKRCFRLPDDVSFADAAAMITVFNTAWIAIDVRAGVVAGDTVLVTGASGGVGSAAVQLCKARGATVIAAVSTPEKAALAKENGADFVINTNSENVSELKTSLKSQVSAATGALDGRGCDVVIETVGGDLFEASLRVLRFAGKLVVVGFSGGAIPAAKANYLLYNNLTVMGAPLDIHFDMAYAELERGIATWLGLAAVGRLKANISERFPLEAFEEAFAQIMGRHVVGKVVLELGK